MILLFVLSIIGGLCFAPWVLYTAFRRRWRKFGIQIVAGLGYVGVLYLTSILMMRHEQERYFTELFGVPVDPLTPVFRYDSERAFNGDGYSIDVYPLPTALRRQFENFDPAVMADLPIRPYYRSEWKAIPWRPTPARLSDQKYLDFAVPNYDLTTEQAPYQKQLHAVLARPGAYFAYFYKEYRDDLPSNVDLFVVDPQTDKLFIINLNT